MTFTTTVLMRRNKRGRRRVAAVVTVLALLTAWLAISAPSGATTQSAVRTAGVSGNTITVGGLVTASQFPGIDKAVQARFDQANQNHEIPGGRTIKYVPSASDQGTPDGALAAARQLVEQDGVFAVVPAMSVFSGPGLTQYLNGRQVPVVGWGIEPGMCSKDTKNSYFFAITGCLVAPSTFSYYTDTTGGMTTLLKNLSMPKSVALVCENYQTSIDACARLKAAYEKAGYKVPYSAGELTPPNQGDFTAVVQKVMAGNPSAVDMLTTAGNGIGMLKALQQAGYKGVIQTVFYAPQLIKPLQDSYVSLGWATPESTSPQMQKVVQTLTNAGVTTIGLGEMAAYFSADYFVKLLQATGKNLTAKAFQQAAAKYTYKIQNVIGPTYYPQGFQVGPSCTTFAKSNGTAFEVSVPYTCYPTALKKVGGKYVTVPYPSGVK
jgi:ABC-type branched-subunit amino acid transport system substrate-binding protein